MAYKVIDFDELHEDLMEHQKNQKNLHDKEWLNEVKQVHSDNGSTIWQKGPRKFRALHKDFGWGPLTKDKEKSLEWLKSAKKPFTGGY